MAEVILHERRDEVVRVIVAFVPAQRELLSRRLARFDEELRAQLAFEELVGETLVDEELEGKRAARANELARVVLGPRRAVLAEIAGERLLTPRHTRRSDDRRERGHARVAIAVPER